MSSDTFVPICATSEFPSEGPSSKLLAFLERKIGKFGQAPEQNDKVTCQSEEFFEELCSRTKLEDSASAPALDEAPILLGSTLLVQVLWFQGFPGGGG